MRPLLRCLRYAIEFVAAFAGFVILLAFLVAWQLSSSPISSDFMTPYIETVIENLVPGSDVKAGGSLLTWDNADRSVDIRISDIKIGDGDGAEIGAIPALEARISLFGMIFGQFMPKDLAIDRPRLKLDRNADGTFMFGGMQVGGGQTSGEPQRPLKEILRNVTEHLAHAALLHKLAVTNASFDVHDDVTRQDWTVNMPELSMARATLSETGRELEYGALDGHLLFTATQKDAAATVDVHYSYDPKKVEHKFSTSIDGLDPAYLAGGHPETLGLGAASDIDLPLTGKIDATLDKQFAIIAADLQIHGGEGTIAYPDLWDKPLAVKQVDLQADFDRALQKLSLSDTHIDFGGPTLDLDLSGGPSKAAGKDMDFIADLKIDNLPMNDFGTMWPKPVVPNARDWLAANLRGGAYSHGEAKLNGAFAWNDLGNLSIDSGSGKVAATNGSVTYLAGMPPAAGVNAEASFTLKDMTVQVQSGGIGDIRMSPFAIQITGLADEDQYIDIPLQVAGPIPDILALLDGKPLGYAKKLGVEPGDIRGSVGGLVKFHFPLLRTLEMKDVQINVTADAGGVASTKLVTGLDIEQGAVKLTLDMSGFTIKGQADINKIPFQVTWSQSFEPKDGKPLQEALLNGVVRDDQWSNLGIGVFKGTKGPVDLTFQMVRQNKTKSRLSTFLDLGAAAVRVDMLDWTKPAGVAATLKMTAEQVAGQPVEIKSIDMRGDHVTVAGAATLSPDLSQILSLDLSQLTVGRTDATLHFRQSFGPGGALRLEADGKSLDIAGLQQGGDQAAPDPRPQDYHIAVDRLYTGDDGEIDMAKGSATRDANGWSQIDLNGVVGGGKPLSFELTPQPDGSRTLAISCDDFGEAVKGLGFTDAVRGGKLSVTGHSTPDDPGAIEGSAKITSFTVVNLPVLALLINATSPFGFSGIITDSADFSRFEGDFTWQGDDLTLTRAHTAGPAMGINIEGKVNMNTGDANLQGTLVPFTTVNKILNYIPVIGDILTGGDNQGVLAVSYKINGPLGKPDISVNPVSLLTPGFLRNLFFRDDTSDKP